jgi:hypothetical protein
MPCSTAHGSAGGDRSDGERTFGVHMIEGSEVAPRAKYWNGRVESPLHAELRPGMSARSSRTGDNIANMAMYLRSGTLNYARRQQYRRLRHAGKTALGSAANATGLVSKTTACGGPAGLRTRPRYWLLEGAVAGEHGHGDGDTEVGDRHPQDCEPGVRSVQRSPRDVRAAPPGSPGACASGNRGALATQPSRLRAQSSIESSIGRGVQPSVVRAFALE